MEEMILSFKERLYSAFWNWVEKNQAVIGEKYHSSLLKEGKNAKDGCNTALKIMANALWMFNMISSWVLVGIGPNRVNEIQHLAEGIDEVSTKRLLHVIAACLSLQYLPKELAFKEIPIISGKHFSLKLFTETH